MLNVFLVKNTLNDDMNVVLFAASLIYINMQVLHFYTSSLIVQIVSEDSNTAHSGIPSNVKPVQN